MAHHHILRFLDGRELAMLQRMAETILSPFPAPDGLIAETGIVWQRRLGDHQAVREGHLHFRSRTAPVKLNRPAARSS